MAIGGDGRGGDDCVDYVPGDDAPVIMRYVRSDGSVWVDIHCGCCGQYFTVAPGGSAFCDVCLNGDHQGCKVLEIMGRI